MQLTFSRGRPHLHQLGTTYSQHYRLHMKSPATYKALRQSCPPQERPSNLPARPFPRCKLKQQFLRRGLRDGDFFGREEEGGDPSYIQRQVWRESWYGRGDAADAGVSMFLGCLGNGLPAGLCGCGGHGGGFEGGGGRMKGTLLR